MLTGSYVAAGALAGFEPPELQFFCGAQRMWSTELDAVIAPLCSCTACYPAIGFVDRRGEEESVMASQSQADGWLAENGPKELELLFRASYSILQDPF